MSLNPRACRGRRVYALVEFLLHDQRGLGRLGREDMENDGEHLLSHAGSPFARAGMDADAAFRYVDANRNGTFSFTEYVTAVEAVGARLGSKGDGRSSRPAHGHAPDAPLEVHS